MKHGRIDFNSVDTVGFNQLRDLWRSVAIGCDLSKSGLKVASVLPGFVSREFGYAFPTNEQLASEIRASEETAKRGLNALNEAHLIERQTMVKRDEKGEAIGKIRRIYLTMPEVKGQEVKGQFEVKGQKPRGEGSPGCSNIPDRTTPDKKETRHERRVSAYVPAREDEPSPYRSDPDFLNDFDTILMAMTDGRQIGAGEIEHILQDAFDRTTNSRDDFMPFHWRDVCALQSGEAAEWFRRRAGQLIYRKAAA